MKERYVDDCVVNGSSSSVFGEKRWMHVDSAIFETRNYMRRHKIAERSNHTQIILLGCDRFRRHPFLEGVLSTINASKIKILHSRKLRKGNLVLLTETSDWRLNYLVSTLGLFIGSTDNLFHNNDETARSTSSLLISPSSRR